MISYLVDIGRIGQYLRNAERVRAHLASPVADLHFLSQVRRAALPLPTDRGPSASNDPFPPFTQRELPALRGRRVAVIASGGSGVLASLVGVVRVLEEAGVTPVGYGVCSGSALFGIPLAAGLSTAEVARATLRLRPRDYVDFDWGALAAMPVLRGRGWSGLVRGDKVERVYRHIVGDVTLGDLPVPVWFPLWNIEENRLAYVGSSTHPDLPAAHAVRMAVALPTAIQPTALDGGWWLDGGVVDILPARPFVEGDLCDVAIVINGFYDEGFEPDHEPHWRESILSVLRVASQSRLMQHVELARRSISDLRRVVPDVVELTPVPYGKVRGAGLYGDFVDNRSWGEYMADGYRAADVALTAWQIARPAPRGRARPVSGGAAAAARGRR
ncbi:MAG: patatin-like phospholipase family protein [Nocardioides sp.]